MVQRREFQIPSHGDLLDAWLYPGQGQPSVPGPAVILGHGLGATKEFGLDKYCEAFSEAGYTCIAFDYRHFGGSTAKPKGLINVPKQLEDFHSVIAYARNLPEVDPEQLTLFGSSFGGGNVIQVASQDPRIKATISQCPFTDGFRSSLKLGFFVTPFVLVRALRDFFLGTDNDPVTISLVGNPGEAALMNSSDSMKGYKSLVPPNFPHVLETPARIALSIPFTFPGAKAAQVKTPILFSICSNDALAPAGPTESYAKRAPKGEIKIYECGHFDIYHDEHYKAAVKDYLAFLDKHAPVRAKL